MQHKYSKKQIKEAIAYWKNKLRKMNEDENGNRHIAIDNEVVSILAADNDLPNYLKSYIKKVIIDLSTEIDLGDLREKINDLKDRLQNCRKVTVNVDYGNITRDIGMNDLPLNFSFDDVNDRLNTVLPDEDIDGFTVLLEFPGMNNTISVNSRSLSYVAVASFHDDDRNWFADMFRECCQPIEMRDFASGDATRLAGKANNYGNYLRINGRFDEVPIR